jgi:hypothetical protein
MAKIDIANEIVEEFPDKGYEAEQLTQDHTEKDLVELQTLLRTERDQEVSDTTPPSPVEELAIEQTEETEKTADEIAKALSEGKTISGKFKLADQRTHYAEGPFTLVGEQEKELPEKPSLRLIERVRSGFIVKA